MDANERHDANDKKDAYLDQVATSLKAHAKMKKDNNTRKSNKIWLWLAVIILIFILFWWIFGIGTQEAVDGVDNGVTTEMTE